MKGKALEGRDGDLLRKYTNIFPKVLGKHTKNLLSDMMIYCSDSSLVFPTTRRKRQRFSQISRSVNLVQNYKRLCCWRVNKYNEFIATKITYHFNNSLCSAIKQLYHFSPRNIPYYDPSVSRKF